MMSSFSIFFFFSSRRRHTRFSRDWSSDVCSSDLRNYFQATEGQALYTESTSYQGMRMNDPQGLLWNNSWLLVDRSEERRVGKECRFRWWRYHEKQKKEDREVGRLR